MLRSRLWKAAQDGLGWLWLRLGPSEAPPADAPPSPSSEDELAAGVPEAWWDDLARLRDELIVPSILAGRLGKPGRVDIRVAVPHYKYAPRHELLSLVDAGDRALRAGYADTEYYRDQARRHGAVQACGKIHRYRRLLHSVRHRGLVFSPDRPKTLPFLFLADGVYFRLDGTHRASVARYLGYRQLPALIVTPRDLQPFAQSHPIARKVCDQLGEPAPDAFQAVEATVGLPDIERFLRSNKDWYQDIDFGSGLRTYTRTGQRFGWLLQWVDRLRNDYKNWGLMSALPDLTGRRVLDIGCNAGLYSCYASMRGAAEVLGVDMDPKRIAQAKAVRDIFRGQGRLMGTVDFEQSNIQESLDLLDRFDTLFACCMLYHLGPVDRLKARLAASPIETVLIQCNTVRGERIGEKNRPGVDGHEPGDKTWGNVLGTVAGATRFLNDCGFRVTRSTFPDRQFAVLVGARAAREGAGSTEARSDDVLVPRPRTERPSQAAGR